MLNRWAEDFHSIIPDFQMAKVKPEDVFRLFKVYTFQFPAAKVPRLYSFITMLKF